MKFWMIVVLCGALTGCSSQPSRQVRIEPVPKANTRQQLKIYPVTFVGKDELLKSLGEAQALVRRFVTFGASPGKEPTFLGSFSDHQIRGYDLRELVTRTLSQMRKYSSVQYELFQGEDKQGYPRVFVVWRFGKVYKGIRISENNDNKAVSFFAGLGDFKQDAFPDLSLRERKAGVEPLKVAGFLKASYTIYPHIENYYICPPSCQ